MPNAVSKIAERLVEAAVALNSKVRSCIERIFLKISKEKKDLRSIAAQKMKFSIKISSVNVTKSIFKMNGSFINIIQRTLHMLHVLVIE